MLRNILVKDLGLLRHSEAMVTMKAVERLKIDYCTKKETKEVPDTLILCEHSPVYTIGIRKAAYLPSPDFLDLTRTGAEIQITNRGGLITFHGPGQLVCYPVLNLRHYIKNIRWYISQLEEVVIRTCLHFGITSGRTKDVGVWVDDRKIAAIGVHASNYISTHGLALNCNVDLSWFSYIDPCGISNKGVTSIARETGKMTCVRTVKPIFLNKFAEVFDCQLK